MIKDIFFYILFCVSIGSMYYLQYSNESRWKEMCNGRQEYLKQLEKKESDNPDPYVIPAIRALMRDYPTEKYCVDYIELGIWRPRGQDNV